jgi:hypothetical protein
MEGYWTLCWIAGTLKNGIYIWWKLDNPFMDNWN